MQSMNWYFMTYCHNKTRSFFQRFAFSQITTHNKLSFFLTITYLWEVKSPSISLKNLILAWLCFKVLCLKYKFSFYWVVCSGEGGVRAAVFVGVQLYRVAPSLYNPILGLVWWLFITVLWPTSSTHWMGGQSHCLCLYQSSLLCSELEDHSSWSPTGLTALNLFT